MTRDPLFARRACENTDIVFNGMEVAVQFGFYEDGRIGEVFMSTRKVGTGFDVQVRDTAVCLSLMLQHGIPPKLMLRSLMVDELGRPEGQAGVIVSKIIERQDASGGSA